MPSGDDNGTNLAGLMMDVPLNVNWILEQAVRNHPSRLIVSRDGDGFTHYTYAEFARRVAALANALDRLGIRAGDRVASFGWNTHRHVELYYGVPCIGAVLHTANIRLFPAEVADSLEHAGDCIVFVDGTLVPAMQQVLAVRPALRALRFVVMGRSTVEVPDALDYEALLAAEATTYDFPAVPESAGAVLCYTSATTGAPKAALFSHRSQVLHALASGLTDGLGVSQRDTVLPIVPQFHVNAWGLPYLALLVGAKLVLPGPKLDAVSLISLIESQGVTIAAGVPTVWLGVRDRLLASGIRPATLERIVIGGSAVPPKLFDDLETLGIRVLHAWGMTELSPIGTVSYIKGELDALPAAERRAKRLKQGPFSPLVAWKVIGDDGEPVAQDGAASGELYVRGPAVAAAYYANAEATDAAFADGWFRTGDIVTVDPDGYMEIVDRAKDMVKSGGEWISSVSLENTLMGHPAVAEACVFGVAHERWIERPVAAVVVRADTVVGEAELRRWLAARVAKWWLPDRIVFVDAIPRTSVGKFLKRALRERFAGLLSAQHVG